MTYVQRHRKGGVVTGTLSPPSVPEGGGLKFFGMFSIKRVKFWIQTCYSGIRGLKSVFWAKATRNLKRKMKKKSGKKVGNSKRLNNDKIFCNLRPLDKKIFTPPPPRGILPPSQGGLKCISGEGVKKIVTRAPRADLSPPLENDLLRHWICLQSSLIFFLLK